MLKPPKVQPWNWTPAGLSPEIARLVARPILVVPFGGYGGAPLEHATKQSTIVNGNAAWVKTPYGPGMYFPNTVISAPTDFLSFRGSYPTTNAATVPHSIALLWQPRTSALHEPFCTAPGSGNRSVGIRGETGTGFYAVHYGVIGFSGIGTVTTSAYYLQLYSYDQVSYNMLVVNLNTGAVVSTSVAETRALATASGGPRIGIQGANESLQGVVVGAAWVRGAWTIKEMEILARNPTGLWIQIPRRRISYIVPSGGGNVISSSSALPLGGSIQAAVSVASQSTQLLPIGGSAQAAVGITGQSSQQLPLAGTVQAAVALALASSQALPLGGNVQAAVALLLQSVQALPLSGLATATSQSGLASTQPLPLGGSAQAIVAISAQSAMALALGGSIAVKTEAAVNSSAALPLGGSIQTLILIKATSSQVLPLSGTIQVRLNLTGTILIDPLGIEFDLVPTAIEFDLAPTGILFITQAGGEVMGPFKIREGELVPIVMTWTSRGVPVDFTNLSPGTLKWTVYKIGKTPIIDNQPLALVGAPASGRVSYMPGPAEVDTRGRYLVEGVAEFTDGQRRKFPGEGEVAELIIGYSVIVP